MIIKKKIKKNTTQKKIVGKLNRKSKSNRTI